MNNQTCAYLAGFERMCQSSPREVVHTNIHDLRFSLQSSERSTVKNPGFIALKVRAGIVRALL
jgi:hypothetical protein